MPKLNYAQCARAFFHLVPCDIVSAAACRGQHPQLLGNAASMARWSMAPVILSHLIRITPVICLPAVIFMPLPQLHRSWDHIHKGAGQRWHSAAMVCIVSGFWRMPLCCVCRLVVPSSVLHVLPICFRRCYISPTTDRGCPYMTEVFSGVLWQWVTCSDTGSFHKYH